MGHLIPFKRTSDKAASDERRSAPLLRTKPMALALAFLLAGGALHGPARAEVPRVAVDIAPVHALVAQVMGDLGSPDLVLPPGVSPHGHALRPSEARALQSADLVVWVGSGLTPWLDGALDTLAADARRLEAMTAEGVSLLPIRQNAVFDSHDHGDAHAHGEEHAHDDHAHDDHAHEEHAHDDHAHEEHAHDHGENDPHVWLDPDNAGAIVQAVAGALSDLDPANASAYAANAEAARADLATLEADLSATLAPVRDVPFVVFHDGYQYFEAAFGLRAAGAISMSDARMPSAARLAELRSRVAELGAACVAAEPQFDPGLVAALTDGADLRSAVLDPLGVALEPGPALYGEMMRGLADALAGCAAES